MFLDLLKLTSLDVRKREIKDLSLFISKMTKLTSFDVSQNPLSLASVEIVGKLLQESSVLESLK